MSLPYAFQQERGFVEFDDERLALMLDLTLLGRALL